VKPIFVGHGGLFLSIKTLVFLIESTQVTGFGRREELTQKITM